MIGLNHDHVYVLALLTLQNNPQYQSYGNTSMFIVVKVY